MYRTIWTSGRVDFSSQFHRISAEQISAIFAHHLDAEFVLSGLEAQSGYTGSPTVQLTTQSQRRAGSRRQFTVDTSTVYDTARVRVAAAVGRVDDASRNRRAGASTGRRAARTQRRCSTCS